jgi:hypothetical protein
MAQLTFLRISFPRITFFYLIAPVLTLLGKNEIREKFYRGNVKRGIVYSNVTRGNLYSERWSAGKYGTVNGLRGN